MKRLSTILAVAFAALCTSCAQDIRTSDVERVLKILSADAMEGRGSLTPGNERAAAFLKSEFAAIGLAPFPGTNNFAQPLPVTAVTPGPREVVLNGRAVRQEDILAVCYRESLRADQPGSMSVAYIGEGENFRMRASELMQGDKNTLVLVSPAHRKTFDRYRSFFSGRSLHEEEAASASIVAVIADSVPVVSFSVMLRNTVEAKQLENIVGMIRGRRADEFVVFSSHYDHLGIVAPVDGDSIANGADDDASGTASVVTLARYYKALPAPERTLVFVAFAAEEVGGFGSHFFSKQLKPEAIVAMCNIEMVGQPSKFGPKSAWITGFDKSDFGSILQESAGAAGFEFHPDPYAGQNLFYRSDNATLARLGVPAHTVSSTQIDADPYYHTVNDEFETLDVGNAAEVVRGIAKGMEPIVAGRKTPSRIKPEAGK